MRKIYFYLSLVLVLFIGGCSKENISISTGQVLTKQQLNSHILVGSYPHFSDETYEVVNSEWLGEFYKLYREDLSNRGIAKWSSNFECNKFAAHYCSLVQITFFTKNFHSPSKAQSLAIGEIWYISKIGPHAIIVAITEKGPIFIEPQNGKRLILTDKEISSIFFKRY